MSIPRRRVKKWKAYFVWVNDGEWREWGPVWAFNREGAKGRVMEEVNLDRPLPIPFHRRVIGTAEIKVVRIGSISENLIHVWLATRRKEMSE